MPKPASTERDKLIGARLRLRRTELGFSQTRLGLLVGVSYQSVQKWEVGEIIISGNRLAELAHALEVTPSYFLGETASAESNETVVYGSSPVGIAFLHQIRRIQSRQVKRRLLLMIKAVADETEPKAEIGAVYKRPYLS